MIEQALATIFQVLSVWLAQDNRPSRRKCGSWCGLAVQPIWFYIGWSTGAWSLMVLAVVFSFVWTRGLRTQADAVAG